MVSPTGNVAESAWFPADCIIKLEEKTTNTVKNITTKVTNFTEGGGAKEQESIAHFGNAFLTVKKPQEDFEVSFDVDVTDTTFAQIMLGSSTTYSGTAGSTIEIRSGGPQNPHKVKLEWKDTAGSDAYKLIYYNALGVSFEKESAADDRLTGTFRFRISPADSNGSPQKAEIETSAAYESGIGSATAGSYAVLEKNLDTTHGYGVGSMLN